MKQYMAGNSNMPRITPNTPRVAPRLVVALAFDRVQMLDAAGPLQAFATASDLAEMAGKARPYEVQLVSQAGGAVATSSGISLHTLSFSELRGRRIDTLVVAGGPGVGRASREPQVVDWLKARAGAARRVCSVCTGAFALAAAGLLDGRRAATHWASCDRLKQRHPHVLVEPDPIWIEDGGVWTSAGVTAGIDLALALIADDLGEAASRATAQHLVMFTRRPGGQRQFAAPAAAPDPQQFAALIDWMRANLGRDLRISQLAARAGMSSRTFARAFQAQLGETPARAVERLRVEQARTLLESGRSPAKRVAALVGFGHTERLRRAFIRRLGVPPGTYRRRFASVAV
jgi:transcriptional regulator GlxA family with amidase domain